MNIEKKQEGDKLTLALSGRLDTNTAPGAQEEISESLAGVKELILDFAGVAYVSSAELRVILATQKQMNHQGSMVVANVSDTIMNIFEMTGFTDILTIQ